MKPFIADMLEIALNRYLLLDPESAQRLLELQGKIIRIELSGLACNLQIQFVDAKIVIQADDDTQPDTIIKGGPFSLLHIALAREQRKQLFGKEVSISGDLDLGQDVIALFDALEIDWEDYLARWVGDVPAHSVGRLLSLAKNTGQRIRQTMLQNVNEYVHEEIDVFPPSEALVDFYQDVDALRMDIDRLTARVEQLQQIL
jgi:ubiquinone biosynthesis protein UbiJ